VFEQALRERIIRRGHTGFEIPESFQIPGALARFDEVFKLEGDTGGGRGAGDQIVERRADAGKETDSRGIMRCRAVLLVDDPLRFAHWSVRIERAVAFHAGCPSTQMTGAPITGGKGYPHALKSARVVSREFLPLHSHEHFGMLEFVAQPLAAFRQLIAKSFAV